MTIKNAEFAVQRGGSLFSCKGSDLNDKLQSGDLMTVQRGDVASQFNYQGSVDSIQDSDLFACTDEDGVTKSVTGAQFKELFGPPWETHDGSVLHIKVPDTSPLPLRITNYPKDDVDVKVELYALDGSLIREDSHIQPGEEVVILRGTDLSGLFGNFDMWSSQPEFSFGPLTNTSKVTNFSNLCSGHWGFKGEGVEYFDLSSADDLSHMFYSCVKFNGDVSNWDVSNVTNLTRTFEMPAAGPYNDVWNPDLTKWDVSNVTHMGSLFYGCTKLNSDITGWDTSKVVTMAFMFMYCRSFGQDLSDWCVSLQPSKPTCFCDMPAGNNTDWDKDPSRQPQWGTCPRGEDGKKQPPGFEGFSFEAVNDYSGTGSGVKQGQRLRSIFHGIPDGYEAQDYWEFYDVEGSVSRIIDNNLRYYHENPGPPSVRWYCTVGAPDGSPPIPGTVSITFTLKTDPSVKETFTAPAVVLPWI